MLKCRKGQEGQWRGNSSSAPGTWKSSTWSLVWLSAMWNSELCLSWGVSEYLNSWKLVKCWPHFLFHPPKHTPFNDSTQRRVPGDFLTERWCTHTRKSISIVQHTWGVSQGVPKWHFMVTDPHWNTPAVIIASTKGTTNIRTQYLLGNYIWNTRIGP